MGIRCDQFVGLPPAAVVFLEEHEVPQEICEYCGRPFPRSLKQIGSFYGMFDDEYPLHRRVLKHGRTADEFHQTAPWSSGPVHHLGLRVSDWMEFVWTEEEIEENSR
jgi:hypothetical protein